jgi:putative oxidoreductase
VAAVNLPTDIERMPRGFPGHTWSTAMKLYRYRPAPGGLNAPIKPTSYIAELSRTWRGFPLDLIGRSPIARWAPIPLRLIVGYGFMEHGFAKLARGPEAFPAILHALGVPAPHLMGWLTILVEIVGGLAVLLGALVPLASIPMAAVLLVAVITVHLSHGFSSIKLQAVTAAGAQFGPPGFETDLLYLACLAALVLGGSGPLAIDGFLAKRREITRPLWPAAPSRSRMS